jgi:polysaccharide deacetylase family sporulation protein PdaB
MKIFWVINGQRFKQYLIIVVAAFFAAVIVFVEGNQLAVFLGGKGPQAVYKSDTDEKRVALTFDISWGDERAESILDVLKQNDLSSTTFFISGEWAERHPEVVERIVKDGHEIGSLGYRYRSYTKLEEKEIRQDITLSQQTIKEVSGETTSLIRPPSGHIDKRVLEIAEKMNQTVVLWSINPKDYDNPGVDQIVTNVTKELEGGDIILLHASDRAKQTHKALPLLIEELKNDGYSFVNVSELLAGTNSDSKEIK